MRLHRPNQSQHDELSKPDLREVLASYGVHVHGQKQMVSCPLQTKDANPSMSVDLDKGLWKCFTCIKGGSSWDLIMEMNGVDFDGARRIAESANWTAAEVAGSDNEYVPSFSQSRSGGVAKGKRDRQGGGGFRPSWSGAD